MLFIRAFSSVIWEYTEEMAIRKQARTWFGREGLKCVILCAGEGKRILPNSWEKPKVMLEVKGKPILSHIIEYWNRYTNDFILVVGYKQEQVVEHVSKMPINMQFVEQKELRGIANAIQCVERLVSDRFIVVLGDCICRGEFRFPEDMEQGVGVVRTDKVEDIKHGYSVEIKDNLVHKVQEKPKAVSNDLCGMGFYFFDRRVFKYIEMARPSKLRNEVEITDVIQDMINNGECISPVFFQGGYLNINYPDDLHRAEELLSK